MRWLVLLVALAGCPGDLRFDNQKTADGGLCTGTECSPLTAGCFTDADCPTADAPRCDVASGVCGTR